MNSRFQDLIFPFLILLLCNWTQGQYPDLECYSCVSTPEDLTCLNDPEAVVNSVKIVPCPEGWCYINRQEEKEIPGAILSFQRGCHKGGGNPPAYFDDVVADYHYVFFIRTCRRSLCNVGDGIESLGSSGGDGATGDLIIVDPESGTSAIRSIPILVFIFLPLIYVRYGC